MKQYETHTFPPVYDEYSMILILGSFPSVKSREEGFFYGHPRNRFWKVISSIYEKEEPQTIEEKKALLLECRIALWDVIASCEIEGSADSSIENVVVNDLTPILSNSMVTRIMVNGKTAAKLYHKYLYPVTKIKAVELPSTSPANATFSLERLIREWKERISNEIQS